MTTEAAKATRSAHRPPSALPGSRSGPPRSGPGSAGGEEAAASGWRASLAPTPELLAKVAALKPIRDVPEVDLEQETATDTEFSLWRFLGRFRGALGLGLILVLFDSLASLAGPYLVRAGINDGVVAGSRSALVVASAVFLAVALTDLVDSIAETFVTGRTAERLMLALRIRIWAKLQRQSLDYYEREMAGRIMTRMTTDVDSFETLLETGLLSAVVSFCTFTGVGVALFFLNLDLALATLGVMVPLAVATVVFRRKAARTYELARDRIAVVNANFQESLSGIRETQAFVHEEPSIARFHRLGLSYLEARVRAQRMVGTYFPFVQFLGDVGDAIVLGVGAGLVASGHLTTGALIAFILYLDLFFSPIQQLSQVFDSWQQTRVSVGRVGELMALETLTPEAPHPVRPSRLKGAIRLEAVHFAYPTGRPGNAGTGPAAIEALRGIDLEIAPGEFVALVGETGAGKSTVVKLLARFYDPTAGAVLVDGTDLRAYDLSAYRRELGYVPQEGFLFTGSIRDNIAYGRPDASDEEVEAAAHSVGADQFIAELANGYETAVSERGRSLSAGQRQLIALARGGARRSGDPALGRGDLESRPRRRSPCGFGDRPRRSGSDDRGDRAPTPDRPDGRSHHRAGERDNRGAGHARRAHRGGRALRRDVESVRSWSRAHLSTLQDLDDAAFPASRPAPACPASGPAPAPACPASGPASAQGCPAKPGCARVHARGRSTHLGWPPGARRGVPAIPAGTLSDPSIGASARGRLEPDLQPGRLPGHFPELPAGERHFPVGTGVPGLAGRDRLRPHRRRPPRGRSRDPDRGVPVRPHDVRDQARSRRAARGLPPARLR